MKIGMNLLLWATHVTEEHYPKLETIKATGFDGVEIPIFGGDDAHYLKLRKKLDELQLKTSTVTVATPEASAISPDPLIRKAAAERLKRNRSPLGYSRRGHLMWAVAPGFGGILRYGTD
jgi:D-psicose/D-tagatose/L-ribulose 3-epimerase